MLARKTLTLPIQICLCIRSMFTHVGTHGPSHAWNGQQVQRFCHSVPNLFRNKYRVTHVSRNFSRLTIQQHTTKDLTEIRLHTFQVELLHVVFDVSHFSLKQLPITLNYRTTQVRVPPSKSAIASTLSPSEDAPPLPSTLSLTRGSVLERRKLNRQSPNARLTPSVASTDCEAGS